MNFWFLCGICSAATIEQLPTDVIYTEIMSKLRPLAMCSLGMTCQTYLPLSQQSLLLDFGKWPAIGGDGVLLDIELLDAARTMVMDECEKRAIQRLIEANYPVLKWKSLDTQFRYQLAKSALFTDKQLDFNLALSEAFPEVTRLLLKHQKNNSGPIPLNIVCPQTADAVISHIKEMCEYELGWIDIEQFVAQDDPCVAAKFFGLLENKSPMMAGILASGDLTGLVDNPEQASSEVLMLAVCMANDKNMDQVLKVVHDYQPTKYLTENFMNWTRYPHLKPVVRMLYEKTLLDDELKGKLAVCFADLELPIDYYESLYGAPLVSDARAFLETYDEGTPSFSGPSPIPLLRVFEVALLSGCSDSLLESIMSLPGFQHQFPSILIAIRMRKPVDFVMNLVQTEPTGEYDLYFETRTTIEFYLEVFRYIAIHRIAHQPSIFYLLLLLKDDQPALEYIRVFLYELDLDTRTSKELLTIKTYDRFVDSDLIRQEVYRFALEKGVEFVWENQYGPTRYANKAARQEFLEFFDQLDMQVVLQYIPRPVVRGKHGNIFGGILNSSFFYAFCSVARRPGGGFNILRAHIEDEDVFEELKFYAELPLGHLPLLDRIVRTNRVDLQMALISSFDEGCTECMEPIIARLRAMQDEPDFKEYVTLLAEECDVPDLFPR